MGIENINETVSRAMLKSVTHAVKHVSGLNLAKIMCSLAELGAGLTEVEKNRKAANSSACLLEDICGRAKERQEKGYFQEAENLLQKALDDYRTEDAKSVRIRGQLVQVFEQLAQLFEEQGKTSEAMDLRIALTDLKEVPAASSSSTCEPVRPAWVSAASSSSTYAGVPLPSPVDDSAAVSDDAWDIRNAGVRLPSAADDSAAGRASDIRNAAAAAPTSSARGGTSSRRIGQRDWRGLRYLQRISGRY